MSTIHGGPVTQKPIDEIAGYIKNLIPVDIPEAYTLKPMLSSIASDESIRNGVVAFRNFLFLLCDHLTTDGHLFIKPQKNPKSATDYPFISAVTDTLIDIGYHGSFNESCDSLFVAELPSFVDSVDESGNIKKRKNPASKLPECLRFLTLCGFEFSGIDLDAKTFTVSETQLLEVSYLVAPILLTGLKAMAVANAEPRGDRWRNGWRNNDVFLRCDYRILKADETDVSDILKDFVHPLPKDLREFVLDLHQRYTGMGMECLPFMSLYDMHFIYTYSKNSRRVLSSQDKYQRRLWEFALSPKNGYCLVVRYKNTDKYADVIEKFPAVLRQVIVRGYGCDRKLRNEPCQGGCQGVRIPLDDGICNIGDDIKIWLDKEASYLL